MSAVIRPGDVLGFAATQLRRTPARSLLTASGIMVGVLGLVVIVALGQGLEAAIQDQLTDDESQTRIVVRAGFGTGEDDAATVAAVATLSDPVKAARLRKSIAKRRRGGPGGVRRTILTPESVAAIGSLEHVASVRPYVVDRFEVDLDGHTGPTISFGVDPASPRFNERVILGQPYDRGGRGVWLHEYLLWTWGYHTDEEQATVLGRTITLARPQEASGAALLADVLRANGIEIPAGDSERAEAFLRGMQAMRGQRGSAPHGPNLTVELPVLGVVRERIESDGFEFVEDSFSMQADLFLPQQLAEDLYLAVPGNGARGWTAVAVEVDQATRVAAVEKGLQKQGYSTTSVGSVLERVGLALAVLTVFVSGLTAVALLVAVLGIVNTMVMNVSERTREIGVLKALGATDQQVRALFVCEAALLGLGGGLVGVVLAWLAQFPGNVINTWLIQRTTEYTYTGTVFRYPWWLIATALGFAVILSVLAAWAPAGRASRIDPVEALRDE